MLASLFAGFHHHDRYALTMLHDGTVGGDGILHAVRGLRDMRPHFEFKDAQGRFIPWTCSQASLLADDWYVVGPEGHTPQGQAGT